jgi:dTDP-4-dehydrorhamnose 3,5-epimerase-like enzyme
VGLYDRNMASTDNRGFWKRFRDLSKGRIKQGPVATKQDSLSTYTGTLRTMHGLQKTGMSRDEAKGVVEGAKKAANAKPRRG